MVSNVQCPVCTLFLLPGMDLSDHLDTHPKEQVIKALVQLSLKSEVSETITPDNPKKCSNQQTTPDKETATTKTTTSPNSEISGNVLSSKNNQATPVTIRNSQDERKESDDSMAAPSAGSRQINILSSRQSGGYLLNSISKSNSSSSSSNNNIFGPPTPFYDHQSQQQQQSSQQVQPHAHHQSQSQHTHQHNFHTFHASTYGCNNSTIGPGPTQPPLRVSSTPRNAGSTTNSTMLFNQQLFSYQTTPKPLQPPPAYGAAISQLRSQNSQNLMVNNVNRPQYHPANQTPTSSSPPASALTATPSRLPPPPPSLMPSFLQMGTSFADTCSSTSVAVSPRRPSTTPPMRPPPHLYRSPMSVSSSQFSRQSSSPFSTMAGSPSVLRYAESPVTAHYLERENGDFIVQETPKHVVECVEKDDGEFSVIERVYHMPPSVVQINEDQEDDELSAQRSNSGNVMDNARPSGATWSANRSPEQGEITVPPRQKKKPGITVLSDVQLDLNEYLDLMGNIIASSKVTKARTEMIKIEKLEPDDDESEEMDTSMGAMSTNADNEIELFDNDRKVDVQQNNDDSRSSLASSSASISSSASFADQSVTSGTTSVIRLAANAVSNKRSTSGASSKSGNTVTTQTSATEIEPAKQNSKEIQETETAHTSTAKGDTPMELEETITDAKNTEQITASTSHSQEEEMESVKSGPEGLSRGENKNEFPKRSDPLPHSSTSQVQKPDLPPAAAATTTTSEQQEDCANHEEHSAKPIEDETFIKKEDCLPNSAHSQSAIKRPFKKAPKKLIIKPKSKETSQPTATDLQTRESTPTSASISPISMDIPSSSVTHFQKEQATSQPASSVTIQGDGLNRIKSEPALSASNSEPIPTPLFADSNEKLPPDDDIQPLTSNAIALPASEEAILPCGTSDDEKPVADLSAFFGQCMKKEDVEDHPMHSIFGMEIDGTAETLDDSLSSPSGSVFPSTSLFAKPLTSSEQLSLSESVLADNSGMQAVQNPEQPQQPSSSSAGYVEYPFCFMYGNEANQPDENKHNISPPIYCTEDFNKYSASTSTGNSASCTWYQSQSSENDFEIDGKGSYLDLDSCKRGASFVANTEGSLPTSDALNIRTDEKMPAKGEISEQESNCGVENSWSQPLYNEFPVRFAHPYQNFMSTHESWSHDDYFRPQNINSSVETNFSLRISEQSSVLEALPSTSKRKNKLTPKVLRKKSFECTHCNTHFPLLKEKNAHLIEQHGYKRVNRRLIRDPPTSTVTTATLNSVDAGASLLFGLEPNALPPPPLNDEKDSKAEIVKIEQENNDPKDCKKNLSGLTVSSGSAPPTSASISRTKYDSMRARDNRMLISFNLNALNVKNEGEVQSYHTESKSSFCCFVCRKDFLTVKLFDEHLIEHPAECFTCHKKFTRWKNFMVHLKRHLGWKDFGCTYCEKKFVVRSALVEHMRMHTGQTPLKCKVCGKSFKRYSNLTQHRKRHGTKVNRSKEYVCYCGEVLPSKARFIWHKETHDSKPKCCPYCRDRFVHANSLRRHIRLAHSEKFDYTEPMECPMCKQIYAKSSIKAHMATHSMDTQHECLICNKSFSTKWNLKIHNWVHANRATKPFKCEHCVKAFVREVDYNNHMNSHKQIKPYTCEHCGCKFIRKYNYIRHRREHHGNKKFTCDICGKLFHRHYYLIEHRRIHTGERPFQCTICGKSSTTKTNHNKHLKIHHSRDPFTSEA